MQRDTAVDLLMQRLGNRTDSALRQNIINEMVAVQETVLEATDSLPWFLLTNAADITIPAGEYRVTLPADFLKEWEEGALWIINADGTKTELKKDDWDIITVKYPGSGKPKRYDFGGRFFLLAPTPDVAYTLRMRYYARDYSLAGTYGGAGNIENFWLKHGSEWLLGEVGKIIATQYLQMTDAIVQRFDTQASSGYSRLMNRDTAMREANKDRRMGDGA